MIWRALLLVLWAGAAQAATCQDLTHEGRSYTACTVDVATSDLRLFHKDAAGDILGSFGAIEDETGRDLIFAMNAGMYHDNREPVGHYIENGVQTIRVIPNAGPGNFGLLPNGVFCLNDTSANVIETLTYIEESPICRDATQSGPMLVIDGALHPRFLPDSTSRFIRNGVGTTADGTTAIFAISNEAVSFHEFGRLYRDVFETPNALYFDGKVSRLFSRDLRRSDFGFQLGPMVGVLE